MDTSTAPWMTTLNMEDMEVLDFMAYLEVLADMEVV